MGRLCCMSDDDSVLLGLVAMIVIHAFDFPKLLLLCLAIYSSLYLGYQLCIIVSLIAVFSSYLEFEFLPAENTITSSSGSAFCSEVIDSEMKLQFHTSVDR
ncbi:hypothetical protein ACET3Z_027437 [Daucus carota]